MIKNKIKGDNPIFTLSTQTQINVQKEQMRAVTS